MDKREYQAEPRRIESETEKALRKTRRSVLKGTAALGVGSVAASGVGAAASPTWTVKSPSDELEAEVTQSSDGQLYLAISYNGSQVLEPSPLGIETSVGDFVTGLSFQGRTAQRINDRYRTIDGPSDQHHHQARQVTFTFTSETGRRIEFEVRVADEGVTYRYRIPGDGPIRVTDEENAFRMPTESNAWLMPYHDGYENIWNETTATAASGEYGFPTLFEVSSDEWLLLTEADVDRRYCASRLTAKDEATFEVTFPEEAVEWTLPLETPWRVAMVGDLGTVVESDLVTDVSPSSNIEDDSWVNPGRVAWSWWSNSGSPESFEIQKEYVDYAAEHGWEYVLVDAGWDAEWVPDLIEYADERDVDIILWSSWNNSRFEGASGEGLDTEAKREEKLSRWSDWGAAGIKVDYMNSDEQSMMEFYDDILQATADHELMINFHGSTVPKGRRRRWPHLMTSEAVRGAEYYKFGTIPTSHNTILPFTRNVVGPMDYTPVTFSATDQPPETTPGHELALSVVYESGWQHLADNVDVYPDWPLAERFLDSISASWDETHFVRGRPGSEATIARCKGKEWFVGTITAGEPQTVEIPLDFINSNRPYVAEVTKDEGERELTLEHHNVRRGDSLSVSVPENGGFTVRLVPAPKIDPTLSVSEETTLNEDGSTTVEATLTNPARSTATNIDFSLFAPEEWSVKSGSNTEVTHLRSGESVTAKWSVTPPGGVSPDRYEGTVQVEFSGAGGGGSLERPVSFRILPEPPESDAYLSDLEWVSATNGWGPVERDMSNGERDSNDGQTITIDGTTYEKGLGCHARSEIVYHLDGNASRFVSDIGVDDEVDGSIGSVIFQVWDDDVKVYESDVMTDEMGPESIDVDVSDTDFLRLVVTADGNGKDYDHADWAGAQVLV